MGAAAAVAAALARQRLNRLLDEEHGMTAYSTDELKEHWQFKIVRANQKAFRKPAELRKLIERERSTGWIFLEKFDDTRVRFKRPERAAENDAQWIRQGLDPYRTYFGMPPGLHAFLTLASGFLVALVVTAICFGLASVFVRH